MKMMQIYAIVLLGLGQISCCKKFGKRYGFRGSLHQDFGEAMLRELEEALGGSEHREQTEQQLHIFEAELQSTFKALPKNKRGALEGPYARYALHRLFVQRYGWQVKGLEMTSGAWYAGAEVGVMGPRVPPKMRELFEKRLGSHGLVLHELAVLAATLDAMFRNDVYDRLEVVYAAFGYNASEILNFEEATTIGNAYMATLMIGQRIEELHAEDVRLSHDAFPMQERYDQVAESLSSAMSQVTGDKKQDFGWELMASWLLTFGRQLGHVEDTQCKVMKNDLVKLEAGMGTGRVRLSDFHKASTAFEEGVSDLRIMEALDETDPDDIKVIIPNYLQGATNCISPAGYYSICCLDECEDLMDKIEAHFEAPFASTSAIEAFVSALPSASVLSNRTLAPELVEALELLAIDQGGMVPLHSKHFAQWMHQAYPRECSHPQHENSDRFDQSLRHFVEELKVEHAAAVGLPPPVSKPDVSAKMKEESPVDRHVEEVHHQHSESTGIAYEILMTCVLGAVSVTLTKKCFKRGQKGRSGKEALEKQM